MEQEALNSIMLLQINVFKMESIGITISAKATWTEALTAYKYAKIENQSSTNS